MEKSVGVRAKFTNCRKIKVEIKSANAERSEETLTVRLLMLKSE